MDGDYVVRTVAGRLRLLVELNQATSVEIQQVSWIMGPTGPFV